MYVCVCVCVSMRISAWDMNNTFVCALISHNQQTDFSLQTNNCLGCMLYVCTTISTDFTSLTLAFRYNLNGPKAGSTDVFVDNLPGIPDNISPSLSGGYWVGIGLVRNTMVDSLGEHFSFLRMAIAKVGRLNRTGSFNDCVCICVNLSHNTPTYLYIVENRTTN